MKLKYLLSFLLIGILGSLTSCNKNDDTPSEIRIQILEDYLPCSVTFDRSDKLFYELCSQWSNKYMIVNSKDDLPDDPVGFNSSYKNINYKEYSLLLAYRLHNYSIDSFRNMLIKNNIENTYDWTISIGSGDFGSDNYDNLTISRFAVKVKKIPDNANLKVWWGMKDLAFDWEK